MRYMGRRDVQRAYLRVAIANGCASYGRGVDECWREDESSNDLRETSGGEEHDGSSGGERREEGGHSWRARGLG